MKKYILSAIMGMGFGFPITLLSMTLIGGYNGVVQEFGVWMVASALYGVLSESIASREYDMSLPLSIGLHFFGCVAITMGAALLNGYIRSIADVLPVLIPAILIYIAVCFICFLLMKQNEKQINKALEEK